MRIALLSDTHSHIDDDILEFTIECDEIWHAGDIGSFKVTDSLSAIKPLVAVHGNIDNASMRREFPKDQIFERNGLRIWMTHIGGYPGRYAKGIREQLANQQTDLFVCGHSHILKVMPDRKYDLLHMNPGACGHHGFHVMRTMLRFNIENGKVLKPEVIELGRRGRPVASSQ